MGEPSAANEGSLQLDGLDLADEPFAGGPGEAAHTLDEDGQCNHGALLVVCFVASNSSPSLLILP